MASLSSGVTNHQNYDNTGKRKRSSSASPNVISSSSSSAVWTLLFNFSLFLICLFPCLLNNSSLNLNNNNVNNAGRGGGVGVSNYFVLFAEATPIEGNEEMSLNAGSTAASAGYLNDLNSSQQFGTASTGQEYDNVAQNGDDAAAEAGDDNQANNANNESFVDNNNAEQNNKNGANQKKGVFRRFKDYVSKNKLFVGIGAAATATALIAGSYKLNCFPGNYYGDGRKKFEGLGDNATWKDQVKSFIPGTEANKKTGGVFSRLKNYLWKDNSDNKDNKETTETTGQQPQNQQNPQNPQDGNQNGQQNGGQQNGGQQTNQQNPQDGQQTGQQTGDTGDGHAQKRQTGPQTGPQNTAEKGKGKGEKGKGETVTAPKTPPAPAGGGGTAEPVVPVPVVPAGAKPPTGVKGPEMNANEMNALRQVLGDVDDVVMNYSKVEGSDYEALLYASKDTYKKKLLMNAVCKGGIVTYTGVKGVTGDSLFEFKEKDGVKVLMRERRQVKTNGTNTMLDARYNEENGNVLEATRSLLGKDPDDNLFSYKLTGDFLGGEGNGKLIVDDGMNGTKVVIEGTVEDGDQILTITARDHDGNLIEGRKLKATWDKINKKATVPPLLAEDKRNLDRIIQNKTQYITVAGNLDIDAWQPDDNQHDNNLTDDAAEKRMEYKGKVMKRDEFYAQRKKEALDAWDADYEQLKNAKEEIETKQKKITETEEKAVQTAKQLQAMMNLVARDTTQDVHKTVFQTAMFKDDSPFVIIQKTEKKAKKGEKEEIVWGDKIDQEQQDKAYTWLQEITQTPQITT